MSYRFLGPDWLDRAALEGLLRRAVPRRLASSRSALVLTSRRLRRDPALLAVAVARARLRRRQPALARRTCSFDYQRVVYYFGVGLALLIGAAFLRRQPHARLDRSLRPRVRPTSRGLGRAPTSRARRAVRATRRRRSRGLHLVSREARPRGAAGLGADSSATRAFTSPCPYLVRRPTLPAFSERQVGFVDRLPLARQAAAILAAGPREPRWRRASACGYAVADPDCAPRSRERARRDDGLSRTRASSSFGCPSRAEAHSAGARPRRSSASAPGARSAATRASAAAARGGARAGARRTCRARRRPCTGSSGAARPPEPGELLPGVATTRRGAARPATRRPRRTSARPRRPSRRTAGRRCATVYACEWRTAARGS